MVRLLAGNLGGVLAVLPALTVGRRAVRSWTAAASVETGRGTSRAAAPCGGSGAGGATRRMPGATGQPARGVCVGGARSISRRHVRTGHGPRPASRPAGRHQPAHAARRLTCEPSPIALSTLRALQCRIAPSSRGVLARARAAREAESASDSLTDEDADLLTLLRVPRPAAARPPPGALVPGRIAGAQVRISTCPKTDRSR